MDQLGLMLLLVRRAFRVPLVHKDHRVTLELKARKVQQELRVQLEIRVLRAQQVLRDTRELKGRPDHREHRAIPVLRAIKDTKGIKVLRAYLLAQLHHQTHLFFGLIPVLKATEHKAHKVRKVFREILETST